MLGDAVRMLPVVVVALFKQLYRTGTVYRFIRGYDMTQQKIRSSFESGELTWGDLLEITGLPAHVLYAILSDLL